MTRERASLTRRSTLLGGLGVALAAPAIARAENRYGPGVTDTEIKIGNTNPYSGNASGYGVAGRAASAYFRMINEEGGINGRKITYISLDDSYSPPKTVELVRQLVERDGVLLMHAPLGTACNIAIHKYMNQKKVPQLFVATGASRWGNPAQYPWTMGWQPDYHTEGAIYGKHILANVKDPRIGILRQNDDMGIDYLAGFREGLGSVAGEKIIATSTYEVTDPTIDSQILQLKSTGANVLFNISIPKFAAQSIRKNAEIGWHPAHYLVNVAASLGATIRPAGVENAQGILTAFYAKDATDPRWAGYPDYIAWKAWMDKYNPGANPAEGSNATGYANAFTLAHVLRACGNDLTRANVMHQAANLKNLVVPMLLPGIKLNTSATDFYPIQGVNMARLEGAGWKLFGEMISADQV